MMANYDFGFTVICMDCCGWGETTKFFITLPCHGCNGKGWVTV